jgi:hypothetical protein
VSEPTKFRLRSAGFKRDIVADVAEGDRYVDRESGTAFVVVGEVLPLGDTKSSLPWAEQNLRVCGCSREQLVQKDVNDCPYCDRRLPAAEPASKGEPVAEQPAVQDSPATPSEPA